MRKLLILYLLLLISSEIYSQDSTSTREQIWPEFDLYYKLNSKFRFFAMYSATKLKNSAYTDGGAGVYIDYFAFPTVRKKLNPNMRDSTRGYYLSLRVGYLHSTTPPESKDPFKENTLVTEASLRFHLPYHILLTNRNRFDWRNIDGNFEPRYRPRLTFERDMRTQYLFFTLNVYGEYYVYFHDPEFNRFRISAGMQTKITTHLECETYFVYQFESGDVVKSLKAIGLAVKFYFNHRRRK